MKKGAIALPADPGDAEDIDATAEALDRGQRARLIRTTRTTPPRLSQNEFADASGCRSARYATGSKRG